MAEHTVKAVGFTIPPKLHDRLKEAAKREHRSVSNLITHLLEEALDDIEEGVMYINRSIFGSHRFVGTRTQWLKALEDTLAEDYEREEATEEYSEWVEARLARGLRRATGTDMIIYPKL